MTFRTSLLAIANAVRSNIPRGLDLRQKNKVTIIVRTWHGAKKGAAGGFTDSALELVERYRVVHLGTREIASSGGKYERGDIRVQNITPDNGAGVGYSIQQLAPSITRANIDLIYQLEGDHPGDYRLVALESLSDTSRHLILRRTATKPTITAP